MWHRIFGRLVLVGLFTAISFPVFAAGYAGNLKTGVVFQRNDGYVLFGTSSQPAGTCSYYIYYYKFDSTTSAGKNMLAVLLAAKSQDKNIEVWYTPSSVPGTDQTNGCGSGGAYLAVLTGIAMD